MHVHVCLAIYNYGRKPLSRAAGNGHEAVVKLLLDQGTEVNADCGKAFSTRCRRRHTEATFLLDVLSREPLSLSLGGVSNCAIFPFTSLSRPLRMALSPVMFGLVIAIRQ